MAAPPPLLHREFGHTSPSVSFHFCSPGPVATGSLWRNWLARSAVNRKDGGSSPPRDECFLVCFCCGSCLCDNELYRHQSGRSWKISSFRCLERLCCMRGITYGGVFQSRCRPRLKAPTRRENSSLSPSWSIKQGAVA